ncbi:MAG: hypothetical protein ACR2O3_04665 [Rhizobiaceae bacterium]
MSGINLEKPLSRIGVSVIVAALFCVLYWLFRADLAKLLQLPANSCDIIFTVLVLVFLAASYFSAYFMRIVFTLVITGLLCFGAWWLWNEMPRFLRRTEFSDYSYGASLVAIFLALSLINPVLLWVWKHLTGEEKQH